MNKLAHKLLNRALRKNRVRSTVSGTTERPRLSVHISNRHITAQVIDDTLHKTVASVSTVGAKAAKGSKTELAEWVGTEIAKKAKAAKVTSVVFDRGSRI